MINFIIVDDSEGFLIFFIVRVIVPPESKLLLNKFETDTILFSIEHFGVGLTDAPEPVHCRVLSGVGSSAGKYICTCPLASNLLAVLNENVKSVC